MRETKGGSILAAVSRIESFDAVGLYAIMLAKRTAMAVCLLLVLDPGGRSSLQSSEEGGWDERLGSILQAGITEGVRLHYRVAHGSFTAEVAQCLKSMDAAILVVGEGESRRKRLRQLFEIEKRLAADQNWTRRQGHHFLMVTQRQEGGEVFADQPSRQNIAGDDAVARPSRTTYGKSAAS